MSDKQAAPPAAKPLAAGGLLLAAFVHLAAFIVIFSLGASLVDGTDALLLNAGVAAVAAPLLALFVTLVRYAPDEPTRIATGLVGLGSRKRSVAVLGLALVLSLALAPLLDAFSTAISAAWPLADAAGDAADATAGPMGAMTSIVVVLAITVVAPFCEELLYRGVLRRRFVVPGWRGVLLVAVAFGMVQLDPRAIPAEILLGLGLGLVAWAGRSTWGSILGHVTFRLAPLVLAMTDLDPANPWVLVAAGALVLVAGLGLWATGRAAGGLLSPAADGP
jgi:membrane protease YdiL (CAAX protease family)